MPYLGYYSLFASCIIHNTAIYYYELEACMLNPYFKGPYEEVTTGEVKGFPFVFASRLLLKYTSVVALKFSSSGIYLMEAKYPSIQQ